MVKSSEELEFHEQINQWKAILNNFDDKIDFIKVSDKKYSLKENFSNDNQFLSDTITPTNLVNNYESYITEVKDHKGSEFTPPEIAFFIVKTGFNQWLKQNLPFFSNPFNDTNKFFALDLEIWSLNDELFTQICSQCSIILKKLKNLKILDPCTGSGIFSVMSILYYLNFLISLFYVQETTPSGLNKQLIQLKTKLSAKKTPLSPLDNLLFQIKKIYSLLSNQTKNIVIQYSAANIPKQLFFMDIDPMALEITEIRLKALLYHIFGNNLQNELRDTHFKSICGDFLLNSIFKDIKFDMIIGNPPYIGSDQLNLVYTVKQIKILKKKYPFVITPRNKIDTYFFFIAKSISLLQDNGELTFIIPNRILINRYATQLRKYITKKTIIQFIMSFPLKTPVFHTRNVHPCIISLNKKSKTPKKSQENKTNLKYLDINCNINKNNDPKLLLLNNLEIIPISLDLIYKSNLFLTRLSPYQAKILKICLIFQSLQNCCQFHEGVRLARIKPQISPNLEPRINKTAYNNLPEEKKQFYLMEIRGKHIKNFYIKRNNQYLIYPKLIKTSNESELTELRKELTQLTIYLRELGETIYISNNTLMPEPIIGYGGIYYTQLNDIKNYTTSEDRQNFLLGLQVYMNSTIFHNIYRMLFSANRWGKALKFRSSYLHLMPLISFDKNKFAKINRILTWLNYFNQSNKETVVNQDFKNISNNIINSLSRLIDYQLLSTIISTHNKLDNELNEINTIISEFLDEIQIRDYTNRNFKPDFLIPIKKAIGNMKNKGAYQEIIQKLKKHPFYAILAKVKK